MKTKTLYYLQEKGRTEIIMLTISKYYNSIKILDLKSKKKRLERKIQKSVADFFLDTDLYTVLNHKIAKEEIKQYGLEDYLPVFQSKLFTNYELEFKE